MKTGIPDQPQSGPGQPKPKSGNGENKPKDVAPDVMPTPKAKSQVKPTEKTVKKSDRLTKA